MTSAKANVLLVGAGGVGTMAAYALETGGSAEVTAILRSNFDAVNNAGFFIDSIDHGQGIGGWKPTTIRKTVPDLAKETELKPYDYIVVTTKNVPDIKPTVVDIIEPAVTPDHTVVVLLQNGLNIEKPLMARFPTNVVLSGISMIGATETSPGHIRHDEHDYMKLGAWPSPSLPWATCDAAARRFIATYGAGGRVRCEHDLDVHHSRWRKLVYNGSFNVVATVLRLDTTRMRIYEHVIDDLVRPAMREIQAVARADGVELSDDLIEAVIVVDPWETWFKPSMCQDIEKGNYIEVENIVGEPVRAADRLGVPVPVLRTCYAILRGLQAKTMEARGLLKPVFTETSRYR